VLAAAEATALDACVALSCNPTDGVYVNQSAAFSDFHGTGGNPAANAAFTNGSFVSGRFAVVQSRRHLDGGGKSLPRRVDPSRWAGPRPGSVSPPAHATVQRVSRWYETGTSARARPGTRVHGQTRETGQNPGRTFPAVPSRGRASFTRLSHIMKGSPVRVRPSASLSSPSACPNAGGCVKRMSQVDALDSCFRSSRPQSSSLPGACPGRLLHSGVDGSGPASSGGKASSARAGRGAHPGACGCPVRSDQALDVAT
jgi:hypothetical protein